MSSRCGTLTWKSIANIEKDMLKYNLSLHSLFTKKIGNGLKSSFQWEDRTSRGILGLHYPRLAALDNNNCSKADRWVRMISGSLTRGSLDVESGQHRYLLSRDSSESNRRLAPEQGWTGDESRINECRAKFEFFARGQNKLPTKENIINKGVLLDNTICGFCNMHLETGDHIFKECSKSLK
ncbi:LOW QUALITY PROTEIN: hypothetical protein OSB04_012391, partial [Centaurea solstitialis]